MLAAMNTLPEFEDLEAMALKLYRAYSCTSAYHRALREPSMLQNNEWGHTVPVGSVWVPPHIDSSSNAAISTTDKKGQNATTVKEVPGFQGDRVLANSIAFMRDALIEREMSYAMAEGDPGRVYEMMKV